MTDVCVIRKLIALRDAAADLERWRRLMDTDQNAGARIGQCYSFEQLRSLRIQAEHDLGIPRVVVERVCQLGTADVQDEVVQP